MTEGEQRTIKPRRRSDSGETDRAPPAGTVDRTDDWSAVHENETLTRRNRGPITLRLWSSLSSKLPLQDGNRYREISMTNRSSPATVSSASGLSHAATLPLR
jgi:hypothetical protein